MSELTDPRVRPRAVQKKKEEESRIEDVTDQVQAGSSSGGGGAAQEGASASDEAKGEANEEDNGEGTGITPVNNGAVHDRYRWTQTLQDLAVYIPVPAGTKAKHLVIDIKKKALTAKIAGQDAVLDAPLFAQVKLEDCFWSVEDEGDGRLVTITLTKTNQMEWWNRVLVWATPRSTRRRSSLRTRSWVTWMEILVRRWRR